MTTRSWDALGLHHPIVQAPMAGTATPELAAAVSDAGGLGSISIASSTTGVAETAIQRTRELTSNPVNVNVFCHEPSTPDHAREDAWRAYLEPWFDEVGATPPAEATDGYVSLGRGDSGREQLDLLVRSRPAVVSLHLGLPPQGCIDALHDAGAFVLASATDVDEARAGAAAGVDAIVAQGVEAGGHRGVFRPDHDPGIGLDDLLHQITRAVDLPVVAAGGLADGADIARVLDAGAVAAQLGTAFVVTPESAADERYRRVLAGATDTAVTSVISGRPARGVVNRFMTEVDSDGRPVIPDFARTYAFGKALIAAAAAAGDDGFGSHWAGTGVARVRPMPAGDLVRLLAEETRAAFSDR